MGRQSSHDKKSHAGNGADCRRSPASSIIIFPVIDNIFLSRKQRDILRELKINGDLKESGLWYRVWIWLFVVALFASLSFVYYQYSSPENVITIVIIKYLLPVIFISLIPLFLLVVRSEKLFLSTTGSLTDGVLVKVVKRWRPTNPGWDVYYRFEDPNGRMHRGDMSLRLEDCKDKMPRTGQVVFVFFDKDEPHKSALFVPSFFKRTCLSRSRYAELKDRPLLREKAECQQ